MLKNATTPSFTKSKHERRVRFADSVGLELVSTFLIDLINLANIHKKALPPPPPPSLIYSKHAASAKFAALHNSQQYTRASQPAPPQAYHHQQQQQQQQHQQHQQQRQQNQQLAFKSQPLPPLPQLSSYAPAAAQNAAPASPPAAPSRFICEFIQPISLLSFKERVKKYKVHLETCQVSSTAGHVSVSCSIRVLNCSYDKSVIVRHTTDDWRTHTDSLASYIPGSCDGWSDRFTSTFTLTNQVKSFELGQRIIFAIRYAYDGGAHTHWDNNGGLNYSIKKVS